MRNSHSQVFSTGLVTLGNEPDQPTPPYHGAGWEAHLAPQARRPPTISHGEEVVLHAKSWGSAQRALDLIRGCHQLLRGGPDVVGIESIAHNTQEPRWMDEDDRKRLSGTVYSTSDFPLACALAARASRHRRWAYGVAKYSFSLSTYSVHHVDLEPWRSAYLGISKFPRDHVLFSHAIIAAYSVVEDLGLQVRASSKNPSRINGKWNPAVKRDLEERLSNSCVDLGETILWTIRGPMRKIEKRRAMPAGEMAPWSARVVRDSEIPVVDAIAYSEWLRSCVASHGVKDLAKTLSPYDVINVQHLARRLLLESLGFWRWYLKKGQRRPAASCRTD